MSVIPIAVFAKPPVAGGCKTRLAAAAFLSDVWSCVMRLPWAEPILATTHPHHPTLTGYSPSWSQGEGDLGARQERVLRRCIARSGVGMAVGADSPGLPAKIFESAREAVSAGCGAVAPSDDGGYVLLALRECPQGCMSGIGWSASTTMDELCAGFRRLGQPLTVLSACDDVDTLADLRRLRARLDRGEVRAPATAAVLSTLPVFG